MRTRRFHSRAGRGCLVCQHKDRVRLEASRIAGVSLDNLARKFAVSRDSIFRHMRDHVDDDLRAQYLLEVPIRDLAEAAAAENVSVLEYLSIVRATLLRQLGVFHEPDTMIGRITTVVAHPFTMARALGRTIGLGG